MKYPSDLTEKQWEMIRNNFHSGNYGNRQKWEKRVLVNAVSYVLTTGCHWRMLPYDFPPHTTIWFFCRRACKSGLWSDSLQSLVVLERKFQDKLDTPSFGILDSQSVKTCDNSDAVGIDGGKK